MAGLEWCGKVHPWPHEAEPKADGAVWIADTNLRLRLLPHGDPDAKRPLGEVILAAGTQVRHESTRENGDLVSSSYIGAYIRLQVLDGPHAGRCVDVMTGDRDRESPSEALVRSGLTRIPM